MQNVYHGISLINIAMGKETIAELFLKNFQTFSNNKNPIVPVYIVQTMNREGRTVKVKYLEKNNIPFD